MWCGANEFHGADDGQGCMSHAAAVRLSGETKEAGPGGALIQKRQEPESWFKIERLEVNEQKTYEG